MISEKDLSKNHPSLQKLTIHAKNSLSKAEFLAQKFGYDQILNIHLFFSILLEKGSLGKNILGNINFKKDVFLRIFQENLNQKRTKKNTCPILSEEIKKTITKAYSIAKDFNYPYVGTEHLTHALFETSDPVIQQIIMSFKPPSSAKFFLENNQLSQIAKLFNLPEIKISKKTVKKTSQTPFIEKFCFNINEETRKKNELTIGREKELVRIINILGRKNKNNPLLIGEPGVGKTALVSGLAQLINNGLIPDSLFEKTLMNLDVAQLIAGTNFRGEFEARLKEIIKEASENRQIIIFIDEIHTIIGAGNVAGSLDLANIIKPALARGEIQIIGATTLGEYKKYIEKDPALERRFQPVYVKEPTLEESQKILLGIKKNYEQFHNVSLSDESIKLAIDLSVQYIQNRFLPDKAIDIIDEAASNVRSRDKVSDFTREIKELERKKDSLLGEKENLVSRENYEKAIELRGQEKVLDEQISLLKKQQSRTEKKHAIKITISDIIDTVSKISGIPREKLAQEKSQKIKNIQKTLSARIIGQTEVMEKLSHSLLRSQSGISNPDRPLGSFLFLGPTGVGKTLTAKVLSQEFFGDSHSLIRIDMSELMERHSVASLIGSPAGYIGYGEGGNLTEKIRRNPYAVVLFDEIEKAHPDVFNILLQILEDGVLTDAQGLQVSFKNTIVIMTSNIGTDDFTRAAGQIGFNYSEKSEKNSKKFEQIKENVIKELREKMKPELLNRLDYILVFNALDKASIEKIVELELGKLAKRILKQGLRLKSDPALVKFISEKSLAKNQGARLVRKNIQEFLENPIAEMIVYEKVENNKINIRVVNKKIILK
jgi:ATP-dependent Clp protease ATP-binding subunit ClpC